MGSMHCQVENLDQNNNQGGTLTVGSEFLLACEGDWPKNLIREKLTFEVSKEQKYQIKLLNFEFRNPNLADLKVTSYVVGPQKFENLILTDGLQKLELGSVQYQIQSVQEGQPVKEPYGPMGPLIISVPKLYFAILIGIFLFFAAIIFYKIRKTFQRKKLLESLKEYDSVLSPIQQYYHSLRRLQRENVAFMGVDADQELIINALTEIDKMLKLYFLRKFKVPAFQWTVNDILVELKKSHKVIYREYKKNIIIIFKELAKAKKDENKITVKDILKISKDTTEFLELIERVK